MNQKLVIAVCTAQRPKMLQACLDSLDKLIQPDGTELAIVVVENDPVPHFAGQAAEDMKTRLSLPVFFYHEKRKGIPFARNTALEAALEHGPDWIALIDDDERSEPDWIESSWPPAANTGPKWPTGPSGGSTNSPRRTGGNPSFSNRARPAPSSPRRPPTTCS
ncbi:glycosyltransferase family 2 protein [Roseibium salinum]|uniref:glycosyltransferase family 2 protein n=1 Tax=Roseibium salinum TaxID=1604349 RepID=UPI0036063857